MQSAMFSDFPASTKGEGFDDFERMSNITRWFSFAIAFAISGLFVWVIKKLTTQPIVGEFTHKNSSNTDGKKAAAGS